ncbi:glycerophosphodiester phosphodiesterase family protein [Microbacterium sp. P07]|uniref:glycerophosphodiester phosphodiesterase family protein n=1 Tax=Microbacterium sp. P07 TaxID=3366952 RepID=UPI003746C04D
MAHPYFTGTSVPRVLAHRGLVTPDAAAQGVVDNSFAAVAEAHAAGAVYVESDCHLTRDGEVVLFHDDDLVRTTGDPRKIADVTVRELEELMADRGGLITLRQALDAFPDTRFNLDVKADAAATPVGRAIAPVAARVLVTSFSDARRRAALQAASDAGAAVRPATSAGRETLVKMLLGVALRSETLMARALRDVDALQIPERQGPVRVLSPRLIEAAHRHGVEVHVWTINDPSDMVRLIEIGCDGVVTDHADLALHTLGPASL